MKESEFDIFTHCGKCKRPLSEHDRYNFGSQCTNVEVEFEEIEAKNLYNSDSPITNLMVRSAGSIGPSKLSNTKTQDGKP